MSKLDLDAIQARADKATQGPWEQSPKTDDAIIAPDRSLPSDSDYLEEYGGYIIGESLQSHDLAHIAGMDPPATLALVAELRAARDVIAALEKWADIDGHYFGDTIETGAEIGDALAAYDKVTGERQ